MHTHQFWWVSPFQFLRYCCFQKRPIFPFGPWTTYCPWSAKNIINQNQLKKFMQVGIDVTCMHTNFVFPVLEILLLSKTAPWSAKNLINQNRLKKFMQVGIDVTCIHTNFVFPVSEILLLSKTAPWSAKNLINQNQLKKFMQVGIDVTCIYTNFGGCRLSGFEDIAAFINGQFSLSDHGLQSMVSKKIY